MRNQRRAISAQPAVTQFLIDAFLAIDSLDAFDFNLDFNLDIIQPEIVQHRRSGRAGVKAPGWQRRHGCTNCR
jgi:hypothetical protein